MSDLFLVLAALRPGANFADIDGTLANVRWDEPLPEGFTVPTQQEVNAAIAALDNVSLVSNSQLKRWLASVNKLATAKGIVAQADDLTQELWAGCATFHIDDPLLTALALTPAPNGMGMSQADLQAAFNAAAKL